MASLNGMPSRSMKCNRHIFLQIDSVYQIKSVLRMIKCLKSCYLNRQSWHLPSSGCSEHLSRCSFRQEWTQVEGERRRLIYFRTPKAQNSENASDKLHHKTPNMQQRTRNSETQSTLQGHIVKEMDNRCSQSKWTQGVKTSNGQVGKGNYGHRKVLGIQTSGQ